MSDAFVLIVFSGQETYKRRRPFYVQAADFRFPIVRGESDLKSLSHAFARLVHGVLGQAVPALARGPRVGQALSESY